MEYKLFIEGQWTGGGAELAVTNKYTGETIATLPVARREDVDSAIAAAEQTAPLMAEMPAHQRSQILARAAAIILEEA